MATLKTARANDAARSDAADEQSLREFVEELAVSLEAEGLPRMAGRIFAFLLICRPPEQTAAELARELHASAGAISTMTRLLVGAGLIERVSRAGQRADHFRIPVEGLTSVVEAAALRIGRYRRLTARGLGLLADRPPDERARLQELHDLYAFFERRYPLLVDDWRRQRSGEERP